MLVRPRPSMAPGCPCDRLDQTSMSDNTDGTASEPKGGMGGSPSRQHNQSVVIGGCGTTIAHGRSSVSGVTM